MSKNTKKESLSLKFDTSSASLNCFIRPKSKLKSTENESAIRRHRNKRKSKANLNKQIQFQEKVFLESVVSKIFNDPDCQGINKLIQDMVFPVSNSTESDIQKETPLQQMQHEQMNAIFRDSLPISNLHALQTINIHDENQRLYHIFTSQLYRRQDKQDCTTTINSIIGNSLSISPRPEQTNEMQMLSAMNQALAMGYSYNFYQPTDSLYPKPVQRKRRSVNGQQANEYRIFADGIQCDGRTTLMVRHIPNKYSEEMLLQEIGRNHKMKINILYLPIDNYNSCNVGYAFVNFIHTKFILEFYNEFNGRRWDRFNSEKICELAYARIQGTTSLMDHFHNSTSGQLRGRTVSKGEERKPKLSIDSNGYASADKNEQI